MKNKDNSSTPNFLKASPIDEKGLPLRMPIEGERRLDQPYKATKGFKLRWSHRDGVQIEIEER